MKQYDNLLLSTREYQQKRDFWLHYLAGLEMEQVIPFFPGFISPDAPVPGKVELERVVPAGTAEKLLKLSKNDETTLYVVLMSAFIFFLHRFSGKRDIYLGTPVLAETANSPEANHLVVIRSTIAADPSFKELLVEMKANFQAVWANREYPLEKIVAELALKTGQSYELLHDLIFARETLRGAAGDVVLPRDNRLFVSYRRSQDGICFAFRFSERHGSRESLGATAGYFIRLLRYLMDNVSVRLSQIEILDEAERKQQLFEFNDTGYAYPPEKTLWQVFQEQAAGAPHRVALIFGHGQVTYGELRKRASRTASGLTARGVKPGTVVGLMVERSFAMIVGIMGILKAGGAYLPMDPQYPAERSVYMLEDSNAALLLTGSGEANRGLWQEKGRQAARLEIETAMKGGEGNTLAGTDPFPLPTSVDIAYIVYTSGSTGKPKGVAVEHRSVLNLVFFQARAFQIAADGQQERIMQFSSLCFDASVEQIFMAQCTGSALVLVDNLTLRDTGKFSRTISRLGVTHLHAVPSYLDELEAKAGYPLKRIISGGEVCPVELARKWYRYCDFYNEYGPTETTVTSIELKIRQIAGGQADLPLGRPIGNTSAYILDTRWKPVPVGIPGELVLGGHGVARGYLNRPELTHEKFLPAGRPDRSDRSDRPDRPGKFDKSALPPGSYPSPRRYITGDIAQWLPGGILRFLGRKDRQIKINGYRIESGEIEACLKAHPLLEEAVVELLAPGGNPLLCAYVVPVPGLETGNPGDLPDRLRGHLAHRLPHYMIPACFILLPGIPRLPTGKIDRSALAKLEIPGAGNFLALGSELEKKLAEIWAGELGIETNRIGRDHHFFSLGGHSLKAMNVVARIHRELNIKLSLDVLFAHPTLEGLAGFIAEMSEDHCEAIKKAEEKEYYELSPAQGRLYILQQLDADGTSYNLPEILPLVDKPEAGRLEKVFTALLKRHESLRTFFPLREGKPVQRIQPPAAFRVEYEYEGREIQDEDSLEKRVKEFVRPFDLAAAPLLRLGVIEQTGSGNKSANPGEMPPAGKGAENRHGPAVLVMDMHHIISDAISFRVLVEDFKELYRSGDLTPLKLQYRDYVQWQNSEPRQRALKQQEIFWLRQFLDPPPLLYLPTDFPRPAYQSYEGDTTEFTLEAEVVEKLHQAALEENITLYMLLLGLFAIFLWKIGGQEDIVIGTPVAGRTHADLELIVGIFINTLALRIQPCGEKTVKQLLKEVKELALPAFAHQEYPFENLVEHAVVERDVSRNPLFDVMFSLQERPPAAKEIDRIDPQHFDYKNKQAKFALTLDAFVTGTHSLLFIFEYSTKLFKQETAARFAAYFKTLISSFLVNKEQSIAQLEILPPAEKQKILMEFNPGAPGFVQPGIRRGGAGEPHPLMVHEEFAGQVERLPEYIALQVEDRQITYRYLNGQSNRLAGLLRSRGAEADMIVAVLVEYSLDMLIAIMGILKSGAAYLPLDPHYPGERLDYMLKDSRVRMLLTQPGLRDKGKEVEQVLDLEDTRLNRYSSRNPERANTLRHLAYAIYTSGSEGRPKGIAIEHHSFTDVIRWAVTEFEHKPGYHVLLSNSYAFDGSLQQIFPPLVSGGTLYLIDPRLRLEPEVYLDYLQKHRINNIDEVPVVMNALFDIVKPDESVELLPHLTCLCLGSEYVPLEVVRKCQTYLNHRGRIINAYGPAETSVETTSYHFDGRRPGEKSLIGKPRQNLRVYILDRSAQCTPINTPGEICISGIGLARGYLNKPEITAGKFVKNPHSGIPGDLLYKSGDLGAWQPDGNIDYLGRTDRQVKIRGTRIELEELENLLKQHAGVRDALVQDRDQIMIAGKSPRKTDKFLCAYIVPHSSAAGACLEGAGLREYLSGKLAANMIPSYFVMVEKFPLSPNGKVDRKALPPPVLTSSAMGTRPADYIEEKLMELWSEVLGIDRSVIDPGDDFFRIGGHSLKATLLVSRVRKEFQVECPLKEIFTQPVLATFAHYIRGARQQADEEINPLEKREYYPQSSAQKRLFFLDRVELIGTTYNMPEVLKIEGEPDLPRLEDTLRTLIDRHESLRTAFDFVDKEPVQIVRPGVDFQLVRLSLGERSIAEMALEFIKPFALSQPPLLRVALASASAGLHYLLYDIHHIIGDGTSMEVLIDDFLRVYSGEPLPPLRLCCRDFAQWQRDRGGRTWIRKQGDYWRNIFPVDREIPRLELPTDYPRPPVITFEGDIFEFKLETGISREFKAMGLEIGATLYMNLLTAFIVLLYKYTGQTDIIVGGATSGRQHRDLQDLIGFFVNSLALRSFPSGEKTYLEFLTEVKQTCLGAFENQDLQFDDMIDLLKIRRDPSRNPLFDVLFVLQNYEQSRTKRHSMEGLVFSLQPGEVKTTKFDIQLAAMEVGDKIHLALEYSTRLFMPSTIENLARHYTLIIDQVTAAKTVKLDELTLPHTMIDAAVTLPLADEEDFIL